MRALLAIAFAALVVVPASHAAMCIRLSTVPTKAIVRESTIIELETFAPLVGGALEPVVVRDYPFRVEAVSPRYKKFRVAVRASRNPYVWRGVFRFPSAGVWRLRVRNFGPRYEAGCGEELRLRVRAR